MEVKGLTEVEASTVAEAVTGNFDFIPANKTFE
jgi:hypothetical protein